MSRDRRFKMEEESPSHMCLAQPYQPCLGRSSASPKYLDSSPHF